MNSNLEWFNLINKVNRSYIFKNLGIEDYSNQEKYSHSFLNLKNFPKNIKKLVKKPKKTKQKDRSKYNWPITLNILGAEYSHKLFAESEDLRVLKTMFDHNIDEQGNWLTPINKVDYVMKGYSLIYLLNITKNSRYEQACQQLASSILLEHERVGDGCLPYTPTGSAQGILVDTLAMICPFLARYSNHFQETEAMKVSINQLKQFVRKNVDHDTRFPYHGYYDDGPKRLGMHAWGRGTGWYMMGLIDTLLEMSEQHPDYPELFNAYLDAANSLKKYQRQDGHWNWAILHRKDRFDSATTSMIGYSLMRGLQRNFLDNSFQTVVNTAIQGLVNVTNAHGVLDGSLGECKGLGKYPQSYGSSPWLQGSATAFAAIYLANKDKIQ